MTHALRDFVLTVEYTDTLHGKERAVRVHAQLLDTAIAAADEQLQFDLADALRAELEALVAAEERMFKAVFRRLRLVR